MRHSILQSQTGIMTHAQQFPQRPWSRSHEMSEHHQQQANPWTVINELYAVVQQQLKTIENLHDQIYPMIYAQCITEEGQYIYQDCHYDTAIIGKIEPGAWIVVMNKRALKDSLDGGKDIWAMTQFLPDPKKPVVKFGWIVLKHHQEYLFNNFVLHPCDADTKRKDQLSNQDEDKSPSWIIWLYDKLCRCCQSKSSKKKMT